MAHEQERLTVFVSKNDLRLEEVVKVLTPKGDALVLNLGGNLNPSRQQRAVEELLALHPDVKIVATTSSPYVLSTISSKRVRVVTFDSSGCLESIETPNEEMIGLPASLIAGMVWGASERAEHLECVKFHHEYEQIVWRGEEETERGRYLKSYFDSLYEPSSFAFTAFETKALFRKFRMKGDV